MLFRRFWRKLLAIWFSLRGVAFALGSMRNGLDHLQARLRSMQEEIKADAKELTDTDEGVMYVVMGGALSAWARMEEVLVVIAEILLLGPGTDKVGLIMYSIINFNVWLTIINDLYLQEPRFVSFKPRWNKISERIRKIKDIRDRLAHEPSHMEEGTPGRAYLRPSKFDVRPKIKKYKPLTKMEIMDFTKAVASISSDLVTLAEDMTSALKSSHEKSPE